MKKQDRGNNIEWIKIHTSHVVESAEKTPSRENQKIPDATREMEWHCYHNIGLII